MAVFVHGPGTPPLGDARWARDLYHAVMTARAEVTSTHVSEDSELSANRSCR